MELLPILACLLVSTIVVSAGRDKDDEDYDPYTTTDPAKREPSPCEICKFFTTELGQRLLKTANSKEMLETGHGLDRKKRFAYRTSELRLTEALHEPHICENILEYNVHAERKGSNRYAKGMSETFSTLHGLVDKGVKVELGIPEELWDKPSAEVTKMHRACFSLAESMEEDIEDWYYNNQEKDLLTYVCRERVLKNKDKTCLDEVFKPKGDDENSEDTGEKKKKKKKKKKNKKPKGDMGPEPTAPPPIEPDSKDEL